MKRDAREERALLAGRLQQLIHSYEDSVPLSVLQGFVDDLLGTAASAKENVAFLDDTNNEYRDLVQRVAASFDAYVRGYFPHGQSVQVTTGADYTDFALRLDDDRGVYVRVHASCSMLIHLLKDGSDIARDLGVVEDYGWVVPLRESIFSLLEPSPP